MTRTLVAGLLAFCCATVPAAAQAPQTQPANYRALFDKLADTVEEHFYDPSFRGADWPALRVRYRARVATVRDNAAFAALAGEMLQKLRSSHLDLMPPQAAVSGDADVAAQWEQIGRETVVTRVSPLSDARRQGLRPGYVVMKKPSWGPLGSMAQLEVRDCSGRPATLAVRREGAFWPPDEPSFTWSVISRGPASSVGYLRVDGFGDDGAELADLAMADLAGASALIIDIRNNPGGNASALRLASYFTQGAQPALGLLTREWLVRLGRPTRAEDVLAAPRLTGAYTTAKVFEGLSAGKGGAMLWTEDLGAKRWNKPVALLIGGGSGSAAEGFAWLMKLRTKAVLVGRETAGALLGSETFDLGQGWKLRVPVHGIWAPDGQDYGDRAVAPDVKVARTPEQLCAGRDPDIEAALDLFSSPTSQD